jgi:ubiquinone/menaquinone biosynthesis C-methylase UbiE
MDNAAYWQDVYVRKADDQVSWYQATAATSLDLLDRAGVGLDAAVLDVGGGASTLVDGLIARGHRDVSVLEIAAGALQVAQARLAVAGHADDVHWIAGDVTAIDLPPHRYDVWHDRAVFHFLTEASQRQAYLATLRRALRPGGVVLVGTFADDGPVQCSGLPVCRCDATSLHGAFGPGFRLVDHQRQAHQTPWGSAQPFTWCLCRLDA